MSVLLRCPTCASALGGSSRPLFLFLSSHPGAHTSVWSFCVFYPSTTLSRSILPPFGHSRSQSAAETPCTTAGSGGRGLRTATEPWGWCWGVVGGQRGSGKRRQPSLPPHHSACEWLTPPSPRSARVERYAVMCARIHAPLSGTRTHQRQRFSPVETEAHGRSQLSARHLEPTWMGGERNETNFPFF